MVSILGSLGSQELLGDLHCREAAVTGALWFCGCVYTHTNTHTRPLGSQGVCHGLNISLCSFLIGGPLD